jgi:acetyl esterase
MTATSRRPLDPALEELIDGFNPDAPGLEELPLPKIREIVERQGELQTEPVGLASIEDRTIAGPGGELRLRVYRADSAEPGPLVLLAHGGGWAAGSIEVADVPTRLLARDCGGVVVSVDYRLAPEHPYPAGLEDAWAALLWVDEHRAELGADPEFLAVAGDSAGGNLAAALALRARDDDGPKLAHQLLVYPVLDRDFATDSYRAYGEGYYMTAATMRFFWDCYIGDAEPDAYAAPLRADSLARLPPATIVQAACDPLFSEGAAFAERLAAARVPVSTIRFEGLTHGTYWMNGLSAHTRAFARAPGDALRAAYLSR